MFNGGTYLAYSFRNAIIASALKSFTRYSITFLKYLYLQVSPNNHVYRIIDEWILLTSLKT